MLRDPTIWTSASMRISSTSETFTSARPLTFSSSVENPMKLKINTLLGLLNVRENFPLLSVSVPLLVPFSTTLTLAKVPPLVSETVPVTVSWA